VSSVISDSLPTRLYARAAVRVIQVLLIRPQSRAECCERKPRHMHCRKLRRTSFSHPDRRQAARAIQAFDDKMGATPKLQPAHNTDPLPRARMVAIMDQNVEGLFLAVSRGLDRPRQKLACLCPGSQALPRQSVCSLSAGPQAVRPARVRPRRRPLNPDPAQPHRRSAPHSR
jgi:hypothetical protein